MSTFLFLHVQTMRSCEHFLVALGSDYSYCFWFRLCQHSYYFIFRLYVNILIASGSDYVNASWVPGYSGITVALYYIVCNIIYYIITYYVTLHIMHIAYCIIWITQEIMWTIQDRTRCFLLILYK